MREFRKEEDIIKRCTKNACITPEETECVRLTCSVNDAVMRLYDLENQIESGELIFRKDE